MLIAIISDTHDHLDNLRKVVSELNKLQVSHLLHAGDFTSPFTWRAIKEFKGSFTAIFGNNDGERLFLNNLYQGRIFTQPHKITLHNRKIVMMHEPNVVESLAKSADYDVVIYGHTHEASIRQMDSTLVINPGELCGWLYGKASYVLLDLETMQYELVRL